MSATHKTGGLFSHTPTDTQHNTHNTHTASTQPALLLTLPKVTTPFSGLRYDFRVCACRATTRCEQHNMNRWHAHTHLQWLAVVTSLRPRLLVGRRHAAPRAPLDAIKDMRAANGDAAPGFLRVRCHGRVTTHHNVGPEPVDVHLGLPLRVTHTGHPMTHCERKGSHRCRVTSIAHLPRASDG